MASFQLILHGLEEVFCECCICVRDIITSFAWVRPKKSFLILQTHSCPLRSPVKDEAARGSRLRVVNALRCRVFWMFTNVLPDCIKKMVCKVSDDL